MFTLAVTVGAKNDVGDEKVDLVLDYEGGQTTLRVALAEAEPYAVGATTTLTVT